MSSPREQESEENEEGPDGAPSSSAPPNAATDLPDYDRAFRQLCHIVAITKDGKEAVAVDNLVLTTLTVDPEVGTGDAEAIRQGIDSYFGIRLSRLLIQESIERLVAGGRLDRDHSNALAVPEPVRQRVEERARLAAQLEQTVRQEWKTALDASNDRGLAFDPLWVALQRFTAHLFRRHGAETALLIGSVENSADQLGSLSTFMDDALRAAGIPTPDAIAAREAIRGFFNTTTPSRTKYLSQLLDGTFTFFALSADEATSSFLRDSLPNSKVFLDTNFIFGLIGLNDDEQNTVATELIEFITTNRFPFDLYYHEKTLEEIERTLGAIGERLRSQRWSRALSAAAVESGSVSTVELRYHKLNATRQVDVDAFLTRYGHVQILLRELGLKIYREPAEDEAAQRKRWLLVAEYNDYKKLRRPDRPRRYEALDHDVSVWISVQRLRSPSRSSLHSGAIFLSNDHVLYRFDWQKKRQGSNSGTVVLPAHLLQVLRPFVALNDDFDRRFVQTFSIPEFRTSSSDYTRTASRVLSYLNTLQDLPQPTAVEILRSEMLMRRVRDKEEGSKEFTTEIDAQVLATNRHLQGEVGRLSQELAAAQRTPAPLSVGLEENRAPDIGSRAPGTLTPRVTGALLGLLLLAIAGGLGVLISTWELSDPASEALLATGGRLLRSVAGAFGVLCLSFGALSIYFGSIRGQPDFLVDSWTHRAGKGALITAGVAGVLLFFGLQ